ncbi:MAG: VIT1/CCC1 transporter family protein [Candidatus Sungbacteria bacterium]|nr:VIT1/CCC1 transporter family protein [Candidatus Sungbacteria bacterium]
MTEDSQKVNIREDEALGRILILDELFDLMLYEKLYEISSGDLRELLRQLVAIERRHLAFWQKFFGLEYRELDFWRRVKLAIISALCRVLKAPAVHLALEAIEIYGIRKYLAVWEAYQGERLGRAIEQILHDEMEHEDKIVSALISRNISPERVRSLFLGFNDGLVEILGAVSGFFAAFASASTVLAAGFTVAVAGAISMAASSFSASSSEEEISRVEEGKRQFLSGARTRTTHKKNLFSSAALVGVSYFFGAMVPIVPVFFGSVTPVISFIAAAIIVILVSATVAFLSGIPVRKRILTNLFIIAFAVAISYSIGFLAKTALGIAI